MLYNEEDFIDFVLESDNSALQRWLNYDQYHNWPATEEEVLESFNKYKQESFFNTYKPEILEEAEELLRNYF